MIGIKLLMKLKAFMRDVYETNKERVNRRRISDIKFEILF